jgi:hypothetical protein
MSEVVSKKIELRTKVWVSYSKVTNILDLSNLEMLAFLVAVLGASSACGFSFAQSRVSANVNQRGETTKISMVSDHSKSNISSAASPRQTN